MKPEDDDKKPGQDPQPANGEPTPDEASSEQALQALRQLPPVQSPDIVRARAKHAFMRGRAGRVAEDAPTETGVEATPAEASTTVPETTTPSQPDTAGSRPHGDRSGTGRVVPPVVRLNPRRSNRFATFAFAAVIVLILFGYGAQAPHPWRMTSVSDPFGDLRGRADRSVGSVIPSGRLDTPEFGEFELSLGNSLRLRLAPCSGIVLPRAPRRWNPEDMTISVLHGELFGSTGGAQLPAAVEVVTDVLTARITGTTFAVFKIPEATCVCLLEGSVQITPTVGRSETIDVPVQSKVLVFNDGRPHEIVPIDDMERSKLQMLRDRAAQR